MGAQQKRLGCAADPLLHTHRTAPCVYNRSDVNVQQNHFYSEQGPRVSQKGQLHWVAAAANATGRRREGRTRTHARTPVIIAVCSRHRPPYPSSFPPCAHSRQPLSPACRGARVRAAGERGTSGGADRSCRSVASACRIHCGFLPRARPSRITRGGADATLTARAQTQPTALNGCPRPGACIGSRAEPLHPQPRPRAALPVRHHERPVRVRVRDRRRLDLPRAQPRSARREASRDAARGRAPARAARGRWPCTGWDAACPISTG